MMCHYFVHVLNDTLPDTILVLAKPAIHSHRETDSNEVTGRTIDGHRNGYDCLDRRERFHDGQRRNEKRNEECSNE